MIDMDLDFEVAKAAHAIRLMERAMHGGGHWEFRAAGMVAPVERIITDDAIVLSATFPEACLLVEPDPLVEVLVDGEVVAVKVIDTLSDGPFTIEWTLRVDLSERSMV